MKSVYLRLLSFVVAAGSCLAVALVLSRPAHSEIVVKNDAPTPELIAGYKNWTRVNPEPKFVPSRIAAMCAMPTQAQQESEASNPHINKQVVVYVNNIGKAAMMEQKTPTFPWGSIIVKEKLTFKAPTTPELLTVMRKREPGYDPKLGDWEYIVFDGPGKLVQASGKIERCQACHIKEKATDYISRSYLPPDVQQKLQ